jgi:hypothetical protein
LRDIMTEGDHSKRLPSAGAMLQRRSAQYVEIDEAGTGAAHSTMAFADTGACPAPFTAHSFATTAHTMDDPVDTYGAGQFNPSKMSYRFALGATARPQSTYAASTLRGMREGSPWLPPIPLIDTRTGKLAPERVRYSDVTFELTERSEGKPYSPFAAAHDDATEANLRDAFCDSASLPGAPDHQQCVSI